MLLLVWIVGFYIGNRWFSHTQTTENPKIYFINLKIVLTLLHRVYTQRPTFFLLNPFHSGAILLQFQPWFRYPNMYSQSHGTGEAKKKTMNEQHGQFGVDDQYYTKRECGTEMIKESILRSKHRNRSYGALWLISNRIHNYSVHRACKTIFAKLKVQSYRFGFVDFFRPMGLTSTKVLLAFFHSFCSALLSSLLLFLFWMLLLLLLLYWLLHPMLFQYSIIQFLIHFHSVSFSRLYTSKPFYRTIKDVFNTSILM